THSALQLISLGTAIFSEGNPIGERRVTAVFHARRRVSGLGYFKRKPSAPNRREAVRLARVSAVLITTTGSVSKRSWALSHQRNWKPSILGMWRSSKSI